MELDYEIEIAMETWSLTIRLKLQWQKKQIQIDSKLHY